MAGGCGAVLRPLYGARGPRHVPSHLGERPQDASQTPVAVEDGRDKQRGRGRQETLTLVCVFSTKLITQY